MRRFKKRKEKKRNTTPGAAAAAAAQTSDGWCWLFRASSCSPLLISPRAPNSFLPSLYPLNLRVFEVRSVHHHRQRRRRLRLRLRRRHRLDFSPVIWCTDKSKRVCVCVVILADLSDNWGKRKKRQRRRRRRRRRRRSDTFFHHVFFSPFARVQQLLSLSLSVSRPLANCWKMRPMSGCWLTIVSYSSSSGITREERGESAP